MRTGSRQSGGFAMAHTATDQALQWHRMPHGLPDDEAARATFSWDTARDLVDGLPDGRGLNIAHEAVDRNLHRGLGSVVALRCIDRSGAWRDITYERLTEATSRFANVLESLGIDRGDVVFGLLARIPQVHVATLGTLKRGAVYSPLFAAFGPEPIRQRLELGGARAIVTTASLYERKLAGWVHDLPGLDHVLVQPDDGRPVPGGINLRRALWEANPSYTIPPTSPDDPALVHFTSGTTGTPKGALHVHDAVVAHHVTAAWALDLRPGDVFWCTADPGWVTGTSYGVIAPLSHGVTTLVDEGEFDAERWYRQLEEYRVTVWYTAPTALRMLMRAGPELARDYDLSSLRFVASVGEPLNAEVVRWAEDTWGIPVHDNWWQTETGAIMIANTAATGVRPGSMGRALPGIDATVLRRDPEGKLPLDAEGRPQECAPDETGELALRKGWPSMLRAFLGQPERYARCFTDGWYRSGDLVRRDADGWYWFVGRGDDVIKSGGHLVGPFEVESVLLEHPAVAEAGVIGVPDPVLGEQVKAFVVLRGGIEPSDELRRELRGLARSRLGATLAPRVIEFRDAVPHTRSGKIMRRLLRARELGLPEGDLSTLEPTATPGEQEGGSGDPGS
jgi:acetyl-CoA synthetase